jgi:hypothetical protein
MTFAAVIVLAVVAVVATRRRAENTPLGTGQLGERARAALSSEFAVFEAPPNAAPGSAHALPARTAAALASREGASTQFGGVSPDPSLATYITTFHRTSIWLVPGRGGVCVETFSASRGGAGSCATTYDARDGALMLASSPPRRNLAIALSAQPIFVVGVVANGTRNVYVSTAAGGPLRVTTVAGSASAVPVSNNVYWFTLANQKSAVTIRDARGLAQQVPAI